MIYLQDEPSPEAGGLVAARCGTAISLALQVAANQTVYSEPTGYREAIQCTDSEHWKIAMDEEYNSLIENGTWELVDRHVLPPGKGVIGCK